MSVYSVIFCQRITVARNRPCNSNTTLPGGNGPSLTCGKTYIRRWMPPFEWKRTMLRRCFFFQLKRQRPPSDTFSFGIVFGAFFFSNSHVPGRLLAATGWESFEPPTFMGVTERNGDVETSSTLPRTPIMDPILSGTFCWRLRPVRGHEACVKLMTRQRDKKQDISSSHNT